jgi:hypothetical protein
MLKITPVLYNGQQGKTDAEVNDMNVACKQASFYCKGSDVFKFFVITRMEPKEE